MSSSAHARQTNVEVATVATPARDLSVGTRLGRYVIRGKLGEGGMGAVYRAADLASGREVALKTLHERDPVALYRLKREFRSLADVSHRNLVSLGELAVEGGWPFFTMEVVDGVDFQQWLDAGPPRPAPAYFDRLRHGLRQIADGLRALHGAGKVHCDLKPSNVLVTRDDRIVIVDFGLVRERSIDARDASGQVWGTAVFMAPEQARTRRFGPSADWYSLGIMLYRALTGVFPFQGSNLQILVDKQEREPPWPGAIARGVPADLDELCAALLRRTPAARPGSAVILKRLGGADHDHADAVPRDTSSVTLRSVFVGRRDELALLHRSLATSRREHHAVLIRGASGVGKSSLVRHFLEVVRSRRNDAVLLIGRCYQRDAMPYRALDSMIDSLSDYLRRLDQLALAQQLPPDAALLGQVFPVLARVPAIAHAVPRARAERDDLAFRTRVFTALRQLLSRLADRAPVIVSIDDLQWADADGLALLTDIFRAPDAPRVLFVGTARTEADGTLPAQLARLQRGCGPLLELSLTPLPPRDAEELAELLLDRLDPTLVASAPSIACEAAGHPLFIDELVRFHVRSRPAVTSGATGLDDTIWQRLRNLDPTARNLMAALAIAEVPLSIDVLSLATGTSIDEQRVTTLTSEHLARRAQTADGSLALEPYHDRIREVLLERIGAEAKTRWHRRLAEALLQTGAAERAPLQLLRHVALSGQSHRAAQLAMDAAHRASASLAFDTAAGLYRLAIEHGDPPGDVMLSLRRGLAEALVNAGRGSEAAIVLEQIAATAADPEVRVDCLRRAAEQLLLSGHLERGMALLESVASECDVRVPPTDRSALASWSWRQLQLRVRGPHWRPRDDRDPVCARALLTQDVHHTVGAILGLVAPIRGMAMASQAALLAYQLGARDRVVRALSTEAISHAGLGNRKRARALLERATRLAHEDGERGAIAWVATASAIVAYADGRFADVIPAADHALALQASLPREQRALTSGGAYEANVLRLCRMFALACLGRCKELRREFHDWLHDARRRGDRFSAANAARGLNVVWLYDDHPERARQELAADPWSPPRESFHVQHWTALRSAVQLHLYCGTGADARVELDAEIERSKGARLLKVATFRAENHSIFGRLALAEAEPAATGASARRHHHRHHHRRALGAARQLDRLDLPRASTTAALLRAGVAFQRGDHDGALEQLLRAEVIAGRCELRLLQAAAQRRRGQLIGGSAGEQLILAVDAWAGREEIRRPDKIVRMLAPGFDAG